MLLWLFAYSKIAVGVAPIPKATVTRADHDNIIIFAHHFEGDKAGK